MISDLNNIFLSYFPFDICYIPFDQPTSYPSDHPQQVHDTGDNRRRYGHNRSGKYTTYPKKTPPPPPIFIDDVIDIQTMTKTIEKDISKEEYRLKTVTTV